MREEWAKETKETNSTTGPSRSFTKDEREVSVVTRREWAKRRTLCVGTLTWIQECRGGKGSQFGGGKGTTSGGSLFIGKEMNVRPSEEIRSEFGSVLLILSSVLFLLFILLFSIYSVSRYPHPYLMTHCTYVISTQLIISSSSLSLSLFLQSPASKPFSGSFSKHCK